MVKKIFITGTNSGIGRALAEYYLENGATVFGIGRKSRSAIEHRRFRYLSLDLLMLEKIAPALRELLEGVSAIDIAVLNAGVLGEIKDMSKSGLYEIEEVMRINVWANKVIIDTVAAMGLHTKQIVGISSGAAVNASRGWGGYSLSKSTLNTLLKLYSKEMPETHFTALAPGVVDTPMVRYITEEVDEERFPSAGRLKNGPIQKPEVAAERVAKAFEKAKEFESGSFLDVRDMKL
ncbi:probable short chain dehydrogenase [Hydrogenimonas sp.]|nr:probable short chain dehydrogenase [Hydrogenimonas sp.]